MRRKITNNLLLCLFLIVGLSACSDDEKYSSKRLVGTWELTYFEEWETKNGEYDHQLQIDYTSSSNSQVATFYEDGTLTYTTVFSGRKNSHNGTWAIKGSKFYFSQYGEYERDDDFEIKTLNNDTFIFELAFTEHESGDIWEFYQKYVFQKISDK